MFRRILSLFSRRSPHRLATIHDLLMFEHKIMASQAELADQIRAATSQLQKIGTETKSLVEKIDALQAIIDAGGEVSPELQAAVDELKTQAQVVDDLVPDAETGVGGTTTPPTP